MTLTDVYSVIPTTYGQGNTLCLYFTRVFQSLISDINKAVPLPFLLYSESGTVGMLLVPMKSVSRIVFLAATIFSILSFLSSCEKVPVDNTIYVTGITLNKTSVTIYEGESVSLTATVSPHDATNQTVLWSTSNANVATVSNGVVSAIGLGTATITAKSDDGGKTATCTVTVEAKVVSVASISLDKTSLELTEGETSSLTATISPSDATNKNVSWSSNNSAVASVDNTGKVTAKSAGSATITVKTEDGNKTATCKVTVSAKTYSVTGVSLAKTSLTITEGETAILSATITPSNATNKKITWSSSNTSVATVDSNGKVIAKSKGSATITVKTEDGGFTAKCSVTVKAKTVSVTGVSLNKTSLNLVEGESETLTATITPSNATNKTVIWESTYTSVAKVNDSGKVTAVSPGSATIIVTTADGEKTAYCRVTVSAKVINVTGISINPTSLRLFVGQTSALTATITPSNATNKSVSWSSSNSSIASVSADGVVTAVSDGVATIMARTEDGGNTATCNVTVERQIFTVYKSYAGCTPDNKTYRITAGSSYSVTFIPNEGFTMYSLRYTMSGKSYIVSGNTINITSVTSDIYITAIATQNDPEAFTWYAGFSSDPNTINEHCISGQVAANSQIPGEYTFLIASNYYYFYIWIPTNATGVTPPTYCEVAAWGDGSGVFPGDRADIREEGIYGNYRVYRAYAHDETRPIRLGNNSVTYRFINDTAVQDSSSNEKTVYIAFCEDDGGVPAIPNNNYVVPVQTANNILSGEITIVNPVTGYSMFIWAPTGVTVPNRYQNLDALPLSDYTDIIECGNYRDGKVYVCVNGNGTRQHLINRTWNFKF